MATSRTYHSLHFDISSCETGRICYIILPERLKESELPWLDLMAEQFQSNLVVISGCEWNDDLTPWKAPNSLKPKARKSSSNTTKATISAR